MNIEKLSKRIDDIALKWDASGGIAVIKDSTVHYQKMFGFQDRDLNLKIQPNDTFLMSTRSSLLIGLSMLILIDQNKIELNDTIDQYIPEYQFASNITIKDLLYHNSGIPDYFYEVQMLELSKSTMYNNQTQHEKFITERMMQTNTPPFKEVLDMINEMRLSFIPGTRDTDYSTTNLIFMEEIIHRITKKTLFEFEKTMIFDPLKMKHVVKSHHASTVSYGILHQEIKIRLPLNQEISHSICFTFDDIIKLMFGLIHKKILSRKTWKLAFAFNNVGYSPIGERINGIICCATELLGYEINLYLDYNAKLSYVHLTNEMQVLKRESNEWQYLRKDLRKAIEEETTYPTNPKLSTFNEANGWDALGLSIDPSQETFVLDAKTTIAYYLMKPKTRRLYVLTEGGRSIGLMVLTINPKIGHFHVDVLLIDKKYQNRGYGKFMLSSGLDILKRYGAKKIEIGVSRRNIAAMKLYQSLGFQTAAIYDEGMSLILDL